MSRMFYLYYIFKKIIHSFIFFLLWQIYLNSRLLYEPRSNPGPDPDKIYVKLGSATAPVLWEITNPAPARLRYLEKKWNPAPAPAPVFWNLCPGPGPGPGGSVDPGWVLRTRELTIQHCHITLLTRFSYSLHICSYFRYCISVKKKKRELIRLRVMFDTHLSRAELSSTCSWCHKFENLHICAHQSSEW